MYPKLKTKLILAPMFHVTNVAFRMLCRKYGASMAVTELLSAHALANDYQKEYDIIDVAPNEKPVAIQLFGEDIDEMAAATKRVMDRCDVVDINMGCPSPRIMNQCAGSALLDNPKKVKAMIEAMAQHGHPISVKMRSGRKKNNAVAVARAAEEGGACAIAIHPRTSAQRYSGKADWSIIKDIKENVSIPVIGNGDIREPQDVAHMMEQTGCDYVMVGRTGMGNPYFFTRANHYLKTGEVLPDLDIHEKIKLLYEYFEFLEKYDVTDFQVIRMSTQAFIKGYPKASKVREALNTVKTKKDVEDILEKYEKGFFGKET